MRYEKHRTQWKDRRREDTVKTGRRSRPRKAEIDRPLREADEGASARQAAMERELQDPERWDGMA